MTEQEWLECDDLQFMIEYLEGKASDRKMRLFGCACCRRAWHLLTDERSRKAVEVCELFADGLADHSELEAAKQSAHLAVEDNVDTSMDENWSAFDAVETNAGVKAYNAADLAADTLRNYEFADRREDEMRAQMHLLRDVFGNPFRRVRFVARWRTDAAVAVARTMYEEREFAAMPLLGDALEDAGCVDVNILDHCRVPGPHIRGCWVVDLVLGKK
jgi:hypothetical protein